MIYRSMRLLATATLVLSCIVPARASLIDTPHLSVTATELRPGDATSVTTAFYSDAPETHAVALELPLGFVTPQAARTLTTDGAHGVVVNWIVTRTDAPARREPYLFVLYVDGVAVSSVGVTACCATMPAARRRTWLPWVAKSP